MEAIRKALKKNSNQKSSSSRHKKLAENWEENREAVKEGVTFYAKYLGSILVEEIDEERGESYGDSISADAVKTIAAMAKSRGKKLTKMSITVSPRGIKVINLVNSEVKTEMSIYRISFCTADKSHDKVFAYVARNTENETMECHAFLCGKTKIAHAVTLTVANAFQLAKSEHDEKERKQKENTERQRASGVLTQDNQKRITKPGTTDNLLDLDDNRKNQTIETGMVHSRSEPLCRLPPPNSTKQPFASGFEDSFGDQDEFASFALSRTQGPTQPNHAVRNGQNNGFNHFQVGISDDELADGLQEFSHGQKLEDFQRQPSVDDLLSI